VRLGLKAREALGAKGYFDIEVEVRCPLRTPYSCIVDGVVAATGCTPGKGNLSLVESALPEVVARSRAGRAVSVRPRRALWKRLCSGFPEEEMPSLAEEIISAPEGEVVEAAPV